MKWIPALAVLGVVAMTIPQAGALTLTNQDNQTYVMEIILGEGSPTVDEMTIEATESLSDFCPDGCVIRLDNGEEMEFDGQENAEIRDGRFILFQ